MPFCICFGRQYGSGGREIASLVAKELGYRYLDKELMELSAEHGNISKETAAKIDERPTSSLLYSIATNAAPFSGNGTIGFHVPMNDRLYVAESEIIKKIASEESAVFVGRCSDYFLRGKVPCMSVFVCGDKEHRVKRIMQRRGCDEKKATELLTKTDKRRSSYYNFYTGRKWGQVQNYDLCIDSSVLGIEETARLIAEVARAFAKKCAE